MNQIVKSDHGSMTLRYEDMERLADSIAKSRLFGINTADQAMVLMMIAHAEGRHPALAARDYDIIQGKPAKKAEAMMRDFLESGGKVEWHALSDTVADATFVHPMGGTARITWDMARAATAGLKDKDLWKKYPRQMLRSRTVSEGVRTIWPSATSGMYVPEEAADVQPSFSGTTIDHAEATPETPPPPPAPSKRATSPRETNGTPPAQRTDAQWRAWLDKLKLGVNAVHRRSEVEEIGDRSTVGDATATGPEWVRKEIAAILAAGVARFTPLDVTADPETGELPAVEIEGEKYMSAG